MYARSVASCCLLILLKNKFTVVSRPSTYDITIIYCTTTRQVLFLLLIFADFFLEKQNFELPFLSRLKYVIKPHSQYISGKNNKILSSHIYFFWLFFKMDIVKTKSYRGVCKIQACFGYKSWRSTQCKHRYLTPPPPLQNHWVFPCSVPFLGRWLLR